MSIFRYLSEADIDEDPLRPEKIKNMTGLDVIQVLRIFTDYMRKYPELLEFPNGV